MAISKEESNLISYIRFPLAAMVVLWHTPQFYHVPISFSDNAFVILSTLFSLFVGIVVYVSVPAFFLMSGYLFFLNSSDWEGGAFLNSYISKIKKRIFTLLIPYILWNSIAMFLNLVKCIASALINNKSFSEVISWLMDIFPRGYWVANHRFMGFENFLGIRVYECSPYDSPLWFIRTGYISNSVIEVFYTRGYYWSSTVDYSDTAYDINMSSYNVYPEDYGYRENGFSVRCVAR